MSTIQPGSRHRPRMGALILVGLTSACSLAKNDPVTGTAETPTGGGTSDSGGGGGSGGGSPSPPGWLEIDGETRCKVDDGSLVGFCGDSSVSFWADGSTDLADADCPRSMSATVWMSATSWEGEGDHSLISDNDVLESGEASVWFDLDGDTWVSDAGTATATRVGTDSVRVVFDAGATLSFIGRDEPGPTVRGEVWCTLPDP